MNARMQLPLLFALLSLVSERALPQFSGYLSGTYGFHQNPMYNFEVLGDQLSQSYLELNYAHGYENSDLKLSYVSGLMVFNRFTERNYYEHNFSANYNLSFQTRQPVPQLEDEHDDEDDTGDIPADSSGSYLLVGLKFGARHDKAAYREFDNVGSVAITSYRFALGEMFHVRITNELGYRRYVYLDELSNVTETFSLQLGVAASPSVNYGLRAGVGLKHFTTSLYDTARFEQTRSYTEKATGKGKGGAKLKVPSSKQLLLNAESDNILQLGAGLYFLTKWEDGSVGTEFLYRRNPGLPSRYLAQYVNTSILNEDIYNDHFSYEGPEARVRYTQRMPLGLQSILTFAHQRKRFGAPAVDILGTEVGANRIDLRSSVELYLSKYIELNDALGLDVALGAEVLRNESNDTYNDYSLFQLSGSIGIGF